MRGRLLADVPRYPDLESVGRAIVITNSERSAAACPLRHWYRYSLGLSQPDRTVTAASFGTGFHDVMETIWKQVRDRQQAGEQDAAPSTDDYTMACYRVVHGWKDLIGHDYSTEDWKGDAARLRSIVTAWDHGQDWARWLDEFEVEAVEQAFQTPIVNPTTGTPLRASMRIVEDADDDGPFLRLARPGDKDWRRVQWPWVFAGRVDLVLRSRYSGALWLLDHKTTSQPTALASGLTVDPQSASYAWLVGQALGERVAGFMWNIVDSKAPASVRILKSGKMSTASNQRVPSWEVRRYLLDEGLPITDALSEFIDNQAAIVDGRWSMLEQVGMAPQDVALAGVEIHADAVRLARMYRDGLIDDRVRLASTHPRVPVCKAAGAFCSYKGPCAADGEIARSQFQIRDARRWRPAGSRVEAPATEQASTNPMTNGDLEW